MLRAPELLTAQHALDSFDSGVRSLDDWLRRRALQNQSSGASRTFVACDDGRVAGYYALAASAVAPDAATGRFRRNMPDPVPVAVPRRCPQNQKHPQRPDPFRCQSRCAATNRVHMARSSTDS